ncbi:MAG: hypothetical protein LBU32_15745 [Clostridiales bacterium]|jgi:hypothetical protein|nr:hypothetical protein [Clostridiales bacterium]
MVRTINFKNCDIKYWIDELPSISIPDKKTIIDAVFETTEASFLRTEMAIEIFLHLDSNYYDYGLLGVEYTPIPEADYVEIVMNCSTNKNNNVKYEDSIIKSYSSVYVGIPEGYVNYVMNRVASYLISKNVQPGVLNFVVSVNDIVGSSPRLFGDLAEMLINLIIHVNNRHGMQDLDKLVKEVFYASSLCFWRRR